MSGNATFATDRFRLASEATKINATKTMRPMVPPDPDPRITRLGACLASNPSSGPWPGQGPECSPGMGAVREYFDVVGGVRTGLQEEPPWWAPAGIAIFGALVVAVVALSLALGVDGGGSPESARLATGVAPLPPTSAPATASPTTAAGDLGPGDAETLALADRSGVFQQVPRTAVAAARLQGAAALGVPPDEVRHQLVSADQGRIELTVSTLDGQNQVTVTAVESGGSWQVS